MNNNNLIKENNDLKKKIETISKELKILKEASLKVNTLIDKIEDYYFDLINFKETCTSKKNYQELIFYTTLLNEEIMPLYKSALNDNDMYDINDNDFYINN